MFTVPTASCTAAFVLYAQGEQRYQHSLVTVISGSCGFLMDYNFFLSEPRWGLCVSRLRPIDNPIMALFELMRVTIQSNSFPGKFNERDNFPMIVFFYGENIFVITFSLDSYWTPISEALKTDTHQITATTAWLFSYSQIYKALGLQHYRYYNILQ